MPSDPFFGEGFCSSFSLPHCHHHGAQGSDPYPAEGEPGCESQSSPRGPQACDDSATQLSDFANDKFSFSGKVTLYAGDGTCNHHHHQLATRLPIMGILALID